MFFRNRIVVGVGVLATMLVAERGFAQDWTYNPDNGHWYRLTTDYGTWVQANAEAIAAGGYLATICSSTENDWLTQLATVAAGANERSGEGNNAWIGYRDAGSGWGWENGETCGYTNLHSNWGSFSGNHAYLHGADHPEPGTWQHNQLHDNDFIRNVRGIIERNTKPAGAIPAVSEWGMMAMAALMLLAGGVVIARRKA